MFHKDGTRSEDFPVTEIIKLFLSDGDKLLAQDGNALVREIIDPRECPSSQQFSLVSWVLFLIQVSCWLPAPFEPKPPQLLSKHLYVGQSFSRERAEICRFL